MGLPNMKRNADEFDIQSEVGKGTTITVILPLDMTPRFSLLRRCVQLP
jgi:anti-sigma regulatory factor (Ser/Thr protein kinase)